MCLHRAVRDDQIEFGQQFGLPALTTIKNFHVLEILKISMIGINHYSPWTTNYHMMPFAYTVDYDNHLFVMCIIIKLCGTEFLTVGSNRVPLFVYFLILRKDCSLCKVRRSSFNHQ